MPACMPAGVSSLPRIKLVLPCPPFHKSALLPLRQVPHSEVDGKNAVVRPIHPVPSRKADGRLDAAAALHQYLRSFSAPCIFLARSARLCLSFACAFLVSIVVLPR